MWNKLKSRAESELCALRLQLAASSHPNTKMMMIQVLIPRTSYEKVK
jgi:hypothetical protein